MPEFRGVKKILVIKLRHIGDVLLTVPVFRALRERFPGAYIAALVNSGTEQVLAGNPLIDEIIIYDRSIKKMPIHQKYRRELDFLRLVRSRAFDLTVDLTSGDRAFLLSVFSGARYRLANDPRGAGLPGKKTLYTHLSQVDKHQHMVLQNIEVVRKFGITTDNLTVDFFIPDEARKWAAELFHGCGIQTDDVVVHVHPTARWLFKCWDDASMARLIDWLLLQGFWVIMTSSSSEKEMKKSKKISSLVGEPRRFLDLSGQTTIKQLAAISAQSTLFVGVDTAPMHIAAAVGIPVVALFGPTGELEWGPWGSQHIILTKKMRCANCHAEICEGLELRECMEAITVDEVVAAVKEILWSRGKPVLTEGVSDNG